MSPLASPAAAGAVPAVAAPPSEPSKRIVDAMIFQSARSHAAGRLGPASRDAAPAPDDPFRSVPRPTAAPWWRDLPAGAAASAVYVDASWHDPISGVLPILLALVAYGAAREAFGSPRRSSGLRGVPAAAASAAAAQLWRFRELVEALRASERRLPEGAPRQALTAFIGENLLLAGSLVDRPTDLPKAAGYVETVLANVAEAAATFVRLHLQGPSTADTLPDFMAFMEESRTATIACRRDLVRGDESRLAVDMEAQRRLTGLRQPTASKDPHR